MPCAGGVSPTPILYRVEAGREGVPTKPFELTTDAVGSDDA